MRSLIVILGCLTVATTGPAQDWTQIKPSTSPSARSDHAMAYDSARQRTVLFGGSSSAGELGVCPRNTLEIVKPIARPCTY